MWGLLTTLLLLPLGCLVNAACPMKNLTGLSDWSDLQQLLATKQCLNVSGRFPEPSLNFSVGNHVKELDLSNNNIKRFSSSFPGPAANLKSLFLHNNTLKELSFHIFDKAPNLKLLSLEKNQLASLLIEDFRHCLEKLSVDCSCDLADDILQYCYNCTASGIKCLCFASEMLVNVTDFHTRSCSGKGSTLYPIIVVPILVLLLLAILVYYLIRKKKGIAINQEKRPSNTSEGASGQPRYISHLPPTFQDMEPHKDYENVYNDQSKDDAGKMNNGQEKHQSRKQAASKRSPCQGENIGASEGHQPIYANTQEVYYNYSGKPISEPVDDTYIIPDQ